MNDYRQIFAKHPMLNETVKTKPPLFVIRNLRRVLTSLRYHCAITDKNNICFFRVYVNRLIYKQQAFCKLL